jgi:hypothetical protein
LHSRESLEAAELQSPLTVTLRAPGAQTRNTAPLPESVAPTGEPASGTLQSASAESAEPSAPPQAQSAAAIIDRHLFMRPRGVTALACEGHRATDAPLTTHVCLRAVTLRSHESGAAPYLQNEEAATDPRLLKLRNAMNTSYVQKAKSTLWHALNADVRPVMSNVPVVSIPINAWEAIRAYKYGAAYHAIAKNACGDSKTFHNPLACAFAGASLVGHYKKKGTEKAIAATLKASLLALEAFVPFAGSALAGALAPAAGPLVHYAIEEVGNGAAGLVIVMSAEKTGAHLVTDSQAKTAKETAKAIGLSSKELRASSVRAAILYLTMDDPTMGFTYRKQSVTKEHEAARMKLRELLGLVPARVPLPRGRLQAARSVREVPAVK